MKAQNLQQAIQFFNPAEQLRGQLLRNWFIQRPQTSRQALRVILESEQRPVKLLFVGHRGSGKSTELNKLTEESADSFVTISFDLLEITGRTTPTYEDLMLTMSSSVTRYSLGRVLYRLGDWHNEQSDVETAARLYAQAIEHWQAIQLADLAGEIIVPRLQRLAQVA